MMNKLIFFLTIFLTLSSKLNAQDYTQYVDPFIGTGYHGHVFLGANVPFGAVQIGPNNFVRGWDWCSGYHYSDSIITGFSQTHLSGTGVGDLGDVLITPYIGVLKTTPGSSEHPDNVYTSKYTHSDETAWPGYYSVLLKSSGIRAELTATERVGFHKYTFPESKESRIAINLEEGIGWDKSVTTSIRKIDSVTYVGYRFSKGWAQDQRLWFAIKLSIAPEKASFFKNDQLIDSVLITGKSVKGILSFSTKKGEVILLKVGISPISEAKALNNIEMEVPGWEFDRVVVNANSAWNNELSKVKVKSNNNQDLRTFYTALYHSFFAPILFNDANGDYRGTDKQEYHSPGFNNYSVFSLWDTYRAEHPLFTLVQPERVGDMVNTMLQIYKQQGKLPIWHLMGNETDCMVGYSAVPVIADAIFKGFKGFDINLAFEAMKASSMRNDYGVNLLKEKGYISADKEPESVSKALEYCISDWCIAQVAKKIGKTNDYEYYSKRALGYVQYFDPKSKYMRAKLDNGNFREPFDPFVPYITIAGKEWKDYTEGNGWQYTWLVPQDVEGLIRLFGGNKPFISRLDSLFIVKGNLGENAPPDISGLIGQYAHGNEPSHHIAYLYAYVGEQWKTAEKVRYILQNMYSDKTDGLCGNEDCGQMSAWYILSSIGFYQVNPANGCFVLGSPLFDEVSLSLPGNKTFTIKANNNSAENKYIQSVKWNGKDYPFTFITYSDIRKGGILEIEMGMKPNVKFGESSENMPKSIMYNNL
jgi:predicted alpha-1,2-mannosidase